MDLDCTEARSMSPMEPASRALVVYVASKFPKQRFPLKGSWRYNVGSSLYGSAFLSCGAPTFPACPLRMAHMDLRFHGFSMVTESAPSVFNFGKPSRVVSTRSHNKNNALPVVSTASAWKIIENGAHNSRCLIFDNEKQ